MGKTSIEKILNCVTLLVYSLHMHFKNSLMKYFITQKHFKLCFEIIIKLP